MKYNFVPEISNYFEKLQIVLNSLDKESINTVMNVLMDALDKGKQIFIMGNGGSAATASHFVCDFNKGLSYQKDKRFKFICLNDNVPTMMAYSNDVSYDDVFIESLKNYYNEGDLVIGISGSGNSKNVLKAIEWANENNATTIGLTGYSGGKLLSMCQYNIHVAVDDMQITEDLHMVLDHCIMKILYQYV